ncbi:MAG: cadherin-like domain-containing protein, partial [Rhodospirillales bacterium]|nr:cadherin-like domain-containing protein [Rhodospirillales bacterium]
SLDLKGNGVIDDITETVSVHFNAGATPGAYADGIAALASLAVAGATSFSRTTSRVNAATGHLYFDDLRVWVDADHDAKTDAGELKTLDELGIASIGLTGSGNVGETIAGNDVLNRTTYTGTNGLTGEVASVDFQVEGAAITTTDLAGATVIKSEGSSTVISYAVTETTGRTIDVSTFTLADGTHPTAFYSTGGHDSFIVEATDTRGYWLGGGTGSLTLRGGAGNDILFINADTLQANIDGGGGFDIVKVNDTRGVTLDLAAAHVEEALGDIGSDTFDASGTTASAFLDGGAGNDILIGGIANDAIGGGAGDDCIDGNRGNDILRGGDGDDLILGGDGDDIIFGEGGDDVLIGGAVSGSTGANMLEGDEGDDVLIGSGGYTVARYRGSFADYTFTPNADGTVTIADSKADRDGTDTLKDISALDFADISQVPINSSLPNYGYGMPVADRVDVSGSGPYVISAATLLANDKHYGGLALSIRQLLDVNGGTIARGASGRVIGGTAALSADGATITFTPDAGFTGVMKFKYRVQDSGGKTGALVQQVGTTSTAEMTGTVYLNTPDQPTEGLFDQQWYLPEVNLLPVWKDYTGAGISIAVFDPSGNADLTHPDLAPNAGESIKTNGNPGIEKPGIHATLVAGVIGAARDGEGVVGVAYDATISTVAVPEEDSGLVGLTNIISYWKNYDIINNSWGISPAFADNFLTYPEYKQAYIDAVSEGRDGKGTILVFAAGNDRGIRNTNDLNETNSRYGITVAGINAKTDLSSLTIGPKPFSTQGATILVSAPGSNIVSTGDILSSSTGTVFGSDYETAEGTSFAAPIVTGIVALMLEANPNLGYRDVQQILAYSAHKVNDATTSWQSNSAINWNGQGLHYSHDYGYGEVDARAAVRLAETWQKLQTHENLVEIGYQSGAPGALVTGYKYTSGGLTIQSGDRTTPVIGTSSTTTTYGYTNVRAVGSPALRIENVLVHVDLDITVLPLSYTKLVFAPFHQSVDSLWGQTITKYLKGNESTLLVNENDAPSSAWIYTDNSGHVHLEFIFNTVEYSGVESLPTDIWVLRAVDTRTGQDINTSINWSAQFDGSPVATPQQFIFTDEYVGGATLTPVTTSDSFNAAAATGNNTIDLRAGSTSSRINGLAVTVASSGSLAKAFGGDSNDALIGNAAANLLDGGRGDDTLTGGAGDDLLDGDQGSDTAVFTGNRAQYVIGINAVTGSRTVTDTVAGRDGTDTLTDIEFMRFADSTVAVNTPPVAHDDTSAAGEDAAVTIAATDLLANDTDADTGDTKALVSVSATSSQGAAVSLVNGNVVYNPGTLFQSLGAGQTTTDTFTYAMRDAAGAPSTATVSMTITGANDAPIAHDDAAAIDQETPLVLSAAALLANDTDADEGDIKALVSVSAISACGAAVRIENGSVVYDPRAAAALQALDVGETATDSFTYTMRDAAGVTSIATVSVTVRGVLIGDDGDNVLTGSARDDIVNGGGGNDSLIGGAGADTLIGGAGIDTAIYSTSGAGVTVNLATGHGSGGDAEGDTLSGIEQVIGSGYDDTLTGDDGNNAFLGGAGNDTVAGGGGNDMIYADAGADTLVGGTGIDQVTYASSASAVIVNLATGTGSGGDAEGDTLSGIEQVIGSAYDDTLIGDDGDNAFQGGGGSDTVNGGGGNDIILGDAGADMLIGGAGIDQVTYASSASAVTVTLDGSVCSGGDAEGDTLSGIEQVIGSAFGDMLTGDDGDNAFLGGAGNDTVNGGGGSDWLLGDAGNDNLIGDAGADTLIGGAGIDTAVYSTSGAGVAVNLATGRGSGGDAEGDTLSEIEQVIGSGYDDTLTGDDGNNAFLGGAGNDTINGGGGNDVIYADAGADTLVGGTGIDQVTYAASAAGVTVTLDGSACSSGDAEGDTLSGIEQVVGSAFDDTLTGDDGDNAFLGGAGNDTVNGGGGNDIILGDAGADTLIGGAGIDQVTYAASAAGVTVNLATGLGSGGDAEGDTLSGIEQVVGSTFDDTLIGDDGDNAFLGGAGDDLLIGGGGNDTYVFGTGDGHDLVDNSVPDGRAAAEGAAQIGVSKLQLWLDRAGDDLAIRILGTQDHLTIDDWFVDSNHQLASTRSSDGFALSNGAVDQLVAAMATFEANYAASHNGVAFDPTTANGTITDAAVIAAANTAWRQAAA